MIKLVTFLGNPGSQYSQTRHNVGWMVADVFAPLQNVQWQRKFKGYFCQVNINGRNVAFIKPQTFMNLSGESVGAALQFFKIAPDELLVVHDDIELDFGVVGFKKGGGLGGHNGLRSIEKQIGTRDFYRLRVGISRQDRGKVADYVLSKFSAQEREWLPHILHGAAEMLEQCLSEDMDDCVQKFAKVKLI